MCGIVGIATAETNGFSYKELEAFETMLFLDTLRGWDSTGVFGVTNDKDVHIVKGAVNGPDFLKQSEWREQRGVMSGRGKFLIGHNRAATRGSVNDKNAHPFWVDDKIILVQNGTMRGGHKHHKDVEVDTEAITHVIAETPDVEEALNKIDASYALVWYNTENHKLHIIRNNERPLYLAMTARGALWWASEASTLLYAAHRHDVTFKEKPYPLHPDTLVTLELLGNRDYKIEEKDITIKPKVVKQVNFSGGRHPFYPGSEDYCGAETNVTPFVPGGDQAANAISAATREVVMNSQMRSDNPSSIEYSCAEVLIKSFPAYHMDVDVATEHIDRINKDKRDITVELEDYAPANNHKDCKVYHVFGRNCDSSDSLTVYHWIVKEDNEMDVVDMCSGGRYYSITPGSAMQRVFHEKGRQRSIVTCYGISAKLLYVLPSESVFHVQ